MYVLWIMDLAFLTISSSSLSLPLSDPLLLPLPLPDSDPDSDTDADRRRLLRRRSSPLSRRLLFSLCRLSLSRFRVRSRSRSFSLLLRSVAFSASRLDDRFLLSSSSLPCSRRDDFSRCLSRSPWSPRSPRLGERLLSRRLVESRSRSSRWRCSLSWVLEDSERRW